jgi:hypothetical protein
VYRVRSYTVYPTGFDRVADIRKDSYCLTVVDAGDGWAIRWRSRCMDYRGRLDFEPPRDARTPVFLKQFRFNEHAALHRARLAIDDLVVDGMTFDEFVEHVQAEARTRALAVLVETGVQGGQRSRRRWSGVVRALSAS